MTGYSALQYIADYLGFSKTTIFNEVHRLAGEYHAVKAQTDHGIRRKRAKETRGSCSHGRSIEDRPAEISDRNTSGHFEADTVLSGKRKGQ